MSNGRRPWRAYGRYGSVGLELILSIGLNYYFGKWADDHFHTRGWLAGIGFLVGCYAGFKALWTTAKKMQKDVENDEAMERGEDPWDRDDTEHETSDGETKHHAHDDESNDSRK